MLHFTAMLFCVSAFDQHSTKKGIHFSSSSLLSSPVDEIEALRELVEDLRSALQGSDARCLALEVALRRQKNHSPPAPSSLNSPISTPSTSITFKHGKLVPTNRIKGQLSSIGGEGTRRVARRRDIRDPLIRELKLIRSSRDGQLEEAIKFNQRLEEELQWAYQEVRKLHGVESALRRENAHIRSVLWVLTVIFEWIDEYQKNHLISSAHQEACRGGQRGS